MTNSISCSRINVDENLIENAKKDIAKNKETFDNQSKIFSLLGNNIRLKIIYLILKKDKMCVCDFSDVLEMKQSPISQHLRKLKDAGVLENKRDGLTIFYFITPSIKQKIKSLLDL